jgi:phytoene dehydrogenase-like protein
VRLVSPADYDARMENRDREGSSRADVVIVGAGHNGLVAAIFLLRAGLSVTLLEEQPVVGGAVRTERPFRKAPNMPTSTGAYLLGVMPPELIEKLGLRFPTMRRDPHYFLPTEGRGYLLFGSDREAMKSQFTSFFSAQDWDANERLTEEIGQIRDDIAPTWLEEPLSIEDTAARYVRPALRQVFVDLCRGTVGDYLDRFGFRSDLVKAMYAVTDGFSGLTGTWDTKGTGMNFLVHNMCRLPGSDGTWMVMKGGMGTVTQTLAHEVTRLGGVIRTGVGVAKIEQERGVVVAVVTDKEERIQARAVVANADPFRTVELVGRDALPSSFVERVDGYVRKGTTFKVNLALSKLPTFTCLPENRGQFGSTMHLLPPEEEVMASLRSSFADVEAGRLPTFPTIEWYIHTSVDPSLSDEKGRLSSALFVQWVPKDLAGTTWEAEESRYVSHLLSICDRFAPGTSDLVDDVFPLHPSKIEQHFGIRHGHIHHVDNSYGFADRLPYRLPVAGLYSASAGTHPAGSVIGCGGHNAAQAVLADLGLS